jgi:micrococcal nuclease
VKSRGVVVVLLALAVVVAWLAVNGYLVRPDGSAQATVEYVHDGDTLFLADGTKVRLLGIDTPEVGEHHECYGDEARELLRDLLPEGTHVRVLADVQPLDQYGRSLLFLYTDDGALVNLQLIEAGAAEAVVLPPNVLFADELEAAEDRAQAAGAGMWGAC